MGVSAEPKPFAGAAWETERIERRVLEIACRFYGVRVEETSLDARLGVELIGDSLDMVEFILDLEEEFAITIPDEMAEKWFVNQPLTVRSLAGMVRARWGTGRPERGSWWRRRDPLPEVETLPGTQLDGFVTPGEWLAGPLHEPIGTNREGYPQVRRRTDGMRCVAAPAGEAWVGDAEGEGLSDQHPAHRVRLSAFLIDAEPVSAAAFGRFLSSVGPIDPAVLAEWCLFDPEQRRGDQAPLRHTRQGRWEAVPGAEQKPVVLVSWYGANAYALWANRRDWRRYRADGTLPRSLAGREELAEPPPASWLNSLLPSETQWEYAARGGERRPYPWGDDTPAADRLRVARHVAGTTYTADDLPAARVSARLGMSPLGLHHVAGNVWQWCRDWYAADFYRRPEAVQPDAQNGQPSGVRSERGGSWVGPAELARAASRRGRPPLSTGRCLGFRCVGPLPDSI